MNNNKMTISIDIEIKDNINKKDDVYATIYYPNEGNIIQLSKGMNTIELSTTIHHEIGHLIDWYLSKGKQSSKTEIREYNADLIGDCLQFKQSS
jgi:hypothetical protein